MIAPDGATAEQAVWRKKLFKEVSYHCLEQYCQELKFSNLYKSMRLNELIYRCKNCSDLSFYKKFCVASLTSIHQKEDKNLSKKFKKKNQPKMHCLWRK